MRLNGQARGTRTLPANGCGPNPPAGLCNPPAELCITCPLEQRRTLSQFCGCGAHLAAGNHGPLSKLSEVIRRLGSNTAISLVTGACSHTSKARS
eukprot:1113512-Pleurochrysis_carterae.AAC.1